MVKHKYVNTFVDPNYLAKLKVDMDLEKSPKKYYKYKTWLHYANLQSWQQQGWHWGYVNNSGREYHCTCGLVAPIGGESDLSPANVDRLNALKLDEVQRITGHRRLPNFDELVVAIFIDFSWDESTGIYFWSAICQKCGEYVINEEPNLASSFVDSHNRGCVSRWRGLRSWL